MKPMVYTKHLGKDRHKLEMAPLVDVVFQLLIFFLVATQVRPTEADFTSNLPASSGPADPNDKTKREQVNLYLQKVPGKEAVTIRWGDQLRLALGSREAHPENMLVIINGDPDVKFRFITQTLDAVMGAGVEQVTFAKPPGTSR